MNNIIFLHYRIDVLSSRIYMCDENITKKHDFTALIVKLNLHYECWISWDRN